MWTPPSQQHWSALPPLPSWTVSPSWWWCAGGLGSTPGGRQGSSQAGGLPPEAPSSCFRFPFPIPTHPHLKLGPIHGHARAAGAAEPSEVFLGVGPPDGLLQLPVHLNIAVHGGDGEVQGKMHHGPVSASVRARACSGDQGAGVPPRWESGCFQRSNL